MVKKENTKKWLVLLVVLVAISLVVDLLSLNVLYGISEAGGLEGELRTEAYYTYSYKDDPYFEDCYDDCVEDSCSDYCGDYEDPYYTECLGDCKDIDCTDSSVSCKSIMKGGKDKCLSTDVDGCCYKYCKEEVK